MDPGSVTAVPCGSGYRGAHVEPGDATEVSQTVVPSRRTLAEPGGVLAAAPVDGVTEAMPVNLEADWKQQAFQLTQDQS